MSKESHSWAAVSRNIGWVVGDRVLRTGISLFVGLWVARYLGPSSYGSLSLAAATVAIFGSITSLGLEAIVVRELAIAPERASELIGSALAMRLTAGAIAAALAIASAMVGSHSPTERILVAILALTPVLQAIDVFDLWFQSRLSSRRTVVAKTAALIVASVLRIAAIANGSGIVTFAVIMLTEAALGAMALALAYRRSSDSPSRLTPTMNQAGTILRESWPYLLSSVAIILYTRIDQVMLGAMLNTETVGNYTAATRLTEAAYFLPMAIMSSAAPVLAKLKTISEERFKQSLENISTELFRGCLIVCTGVTLLSGLIIRLFYGARFASAAPVLGIHIWTFAFVSIGVVSSLWLVNFGLQHVALMRSILAAVINIVLNLFLIPRFGAAGAAAATLVTQIVATYLSNLVSSATRPLFAQQTRSIWNSLKLWQGFRFQSYLKADR